MRSPYSCTAPRPHPGDRIVRAFGPLKPHARSVLAWVLRCAERAGERRTLAQLGDWQLRDIGISRADADDEAAKPCWRV